MNAKETAFMRSKQSMESGVSNSVSALVRVVVKLEKRDGADIDEAEENEIDEEREREELP